MKTHFDLSSIELILWYKTIYHKKSKTAYVIFGLEIINYIYYIIIYM